MTGKGSLYSEGSVMAALPSENALVKVSLSGLKSKRGIVLSIGYKGNAAVFFGSTGVVELTLGSGGKRWSAVGEDKRVALYRKLILALDAHYLDDSDDILRRLMEGLALEPAEIEAQRLAKLTLEAQRLASTADVPPQPHGGVAAGDDDLDDDLLGSPLPDRDDVL